jgi:hypothetical protein
VDVGAGERRGRRGEGDAAADGAAVVHCFCVQTLLTCCRKCFAVIVTSTVLAGRGASSHQPGASSHQEPEAELAPTNSELAPTRNPELAPTNPELAPTNPDRCGKQLGRPWRQEYHWRLKDMRRRRLAMRFSFTHFIVQARRTI